MRPVPASLGSVPEVGAGQLAGEVARLADRVALLARRVDAAAEVRWSSPAATAYRHEVAARAARVRAVAALLEEAASGLARAAGGGRT